MDPLSYIYTEAKHSSLLPRAAKDPRPAAELIYNASKQTVGGIVY